jgi:hypothetical protein
MREVAIGFAGIRSIQSASSPSDAGRINFLRRKPSRFGIVDDAVGHGINGNDLGDTLSGSSDDDGWRNMNRD